VTQAIAAKLGLSVQELRVKLLSGHTLEELARADNVPMQEVQATMSAALRQAFGPVSVGGTAAAEAPSVSDVNGSAESNPVGGHPPTGAGPWRNWIDSLELAVGQRVNVRV
jgi:hypothetical protein